MKILFLIREGLAGFKRARLSAVITIITVMLSLSLIGIFGIIVQNLSDTFQKLYTHIRLEIFVDPSITPDQIDSLASALLAMNVFENITFISPEKALQEFEAEFGDISNLLDTNPLPPSFRVTLPGGYRRLQDIESIVKKIEAMEEVDEVQYQKTIISLMNKYFLLGVIVASAVGATIFLISTLLIFNTIRLTIHARKTLISIMRLVGATNFLIKGPFVIEGIFQGLIGSLLACGLLWLGIDFVRTAFFPELKIPLYYFAFLIATGTLLGLTGSYISIGKYLR